MNYTTVSGRKGVNPTWNWNDSGRKGIDPLNYSNDSGIGEKNSL